MSLEQFEKDLVNVSAELEQLMAKYNIMLGQKLALQHVVTKLKDGAQVVEEVANVVEKVAEVVEPVVETVS